jgi:hypothetical protein
VRRSRQNDERPFSRDDEEVAQVSAWLERFRRPPGVPTAGVPRSATEELETELTPVFAELDEFDAEAARLREDASRMAARRIEAAARDAEHVLADWRRRADAERVRAETERRKALARAAREAEVEAERVAAVARESRRAQIPGLVEKALALLREELR